MGVQRGLIGDIVKRFEQKGFKLVAAKLYSPSRAHFEKHYEDLKGKKFFPSMIDYMITGPVFCMVWAGKGAVKTGRKMLGETNPPTPCPGPSAATSASTSGATSATAPTPSRTPRRRSRSGSPRARTRGRRTRSRGSTSRLVRWRKIGSKK